MTDLDPMAVALRIAAVLDEAKVAYAIGGALAYGLWGDPRGTHDVDLNLFVDAEVLGDALRVVSSAGVSIDVFAPSIPFSWEAGQTRVPIDGQEPRCSGRRGSTVAIDVAPRTVKRNGKAAKRAAQAGNRPEFSRFDDDGRSTVDQAMPESFLRSVLPSSRRSACFA